MDAELTVALSAKMRKVADDILSSKAFKDVVRGAEEVLRKNSDALGNLRSSVTLLLTTS